VHWSAQEAHSKYWHLPDDPLVQKIQFYEGLSGAKEFWKIVEGKGENSQNKCAWVTASKGHPKRQGCS